MGIVSSQHTNGKCGRPAGSFALSCLSNTVWIEMKKLSVQVNCRLADLDGEIVFLMSSGDLAIQNSRGPAATLCTTSDMSGSSAEASHRRSGLLLRCLRTHPGPRGLAVRCCGRFGKNWRRNSRACKRWCLYCNFFRMAIWVCFSTSLVQISRMSHGMAKKKLGGNGFAGGIRKHQCLS